MFSAYYWYRETLNISPNVESPQEVNWTIGLTLNTNYLFYLQLSLTALCLILSWVLVYLAMVKGITESPKVVYVTALFPYLVLIIFFIRAVTLRGMEDGIAHLFTPKVGPDLQSPWLPVYFSSVLSTAGPHCLAGGGNSDFLLPRPIFWQSHCLQLLQSCQQ